MGRITETVKVLLIVNVLFFVGSLLTSSSDLLSVWFIENDNFGYWQIVTHMFMHSQTFFPHIIFNMLALWMFGTPLEQMWGRNKFLFFYFSAGIGAHFFSLAIDYYQFNSALNILVESGFNKTEILALMNEGKYMPIWQDILSLDDYEKFARTFYGSSLGASGAVMGLLVAFGLSFPNVKLMLLFFPVPIKAKYFIPLIVGYDIIAGLSGGASIFGVNIGHWAHVGGALIGFIIAYYWKKNSFNQNRWD